MKEKTIKIIDFFIEAGILLIVFSVPVYFSFFYQNYTLFSLDKAVLFKVLMEFLLILVLLKILLKRQVFFIVKGKYIMLPLVFLLGLVFSTFISIDWRTSFWGSYMRQDGLFIYFHYFLFFLIIVYYLAGFTEEERVKKRIERIITAILFGSFIVSFYGILQWLGFEFISWQKDIMNGQRVTSTMGQPVFLGNYLLLVIFLTVYKLIKNTLFSKWPACRTGRGVGLPASAKLWQAGGFLRWHIDKSFIFIIIYFLLLLSQFFCLIFTYTRGAWLGFIFGIMFVIFLYFHITKAPLIKGVRGIKIFWSIIFFIVVITFFLFKNSDNFSNSFFISRLKSITDFKSGSLAMRVETWKADLALWSQSPVIGYGLESQHELFIKYYNPLWSIYEKINSSSDRAHNIVLDFLLEGGVILLFLYLVFISGVLYLTIKKLKNIKNAENFYLLFFLVITIISYHFSLLFSFPMVETNVLFWAYIGIIIFLLNNFKVKEIINFKKIKKIYFALFIYFFIIFVLLSIYFIINNIKSIRADYYFKKGRTAYLRENYPTMLENYIRTFNLNSVQEYYYWFYINDLIDSLNKVNNEDYRKSVFNYFDWVLVNNFGHISGFQRLYLEIKIYPILGKYIDPSYFKKAELAFNDILKLTPLYPDAYYLGGRMYMYVGDYKKAITIFNLALSVIPDENNPKLNIPELSEHKNEVNNFRMNIYNHIAYSYLKLSDHDNSTKYYKKIIAINPYNLEAYKMIANNYYLSHNLDMAIWYNKRGAMLDSANSEWYFSLAVIYKEKGDKVSAGEYAAKVLKLSPKNKQIQELIKELK